MAEITVVTKSVRVQPRVGLLPAGTCYSLYGSLYVKMYGGSSLALDTLRLKHNLDAEAVPDIIYEKITITVE